jgi:cell division protein FtsB
VARSEAPTRGEPAPAESRGSSWLRGAHVSGFSILMVGILVLAVVVLAPSLRVYLEQRDQIADLRADVEGQQQQVDDLRAERERWNDRSYITTQARDRLYYVLPGEVSYLVIDDVGRPAETGVDAGEPTAAIEETEVDWVGTFFSSVIASGLAETAPAGAGG